MEKINKKKTSAFLGLLALVISTSFGNYADASVLVRDPIQIQNETWTVGFGETQGQITLILPISDTNDVVFYGEKYHNVSINDKYAGRMTSSGQVSWLTEFDPIPEKFLGMHVSSDGSQIFLFFKHKINDPVQIMELWIYTLDAVTGELLDQDMIDPGTFGNSVINYLTVASNPVNSDELYIAMSNYSSTFSWYCTRLFAWSISQESVLWNKNLTTGGRDLIPIKMEYYPGQNRLILATKSYTSSIDAYTTLWKIEPVANGYQSDTNILAEGSNLIIVRDFEIHLDKIYLLMQVSDTITPSSLYRYIQVLDMGFAVQYEMKMDLVFDYLYTNQIRVIDEDRLVVMGTTYFDFLSEDESTQETFIQAYQFNEDHDLLDPVGMWRFGLNVYITVAKTATILENGCYMIAGLTDAVMLGEQIGFISQFPSLYNDASSDPEEYTPVSELPFMERILQQDWPIAGSVGGIGFLIGAILVGLLKKKK